MRKALPDFTCPRQFLQPVCIPMRQHSEIRRDRFLFRIVRESSKHSPFGACPKYTMIGEINPAEKINSQSKSFNEYFVGVK